MYGLLMNILLILLKIVTISITRVVGHSVWFHEVLSLAISNRGLGQLIRIKNPASKEVYWCLKKARKRGHHESVPSCCR